jgi:SdrD B-like domain
MSREIRQAELREHTRQLLRGPLKHIRVAALAAALLPLASVAAAPASAQQFCGNSAGVCGTVFNDVNDNGILDTGETGIEGVKVTACLKCDGTDNLYTTTNVNGSYFFQAFGGTFTISVLIPTGTQASPYNVGGNVGSPNGTGYSVALVTSTELCCTDFGFFTPSASSCTIPATSEIISSTSWNQFNVPAGTAPVVWVHAQFKPTGVPTTTTTTAQFTGVSFVLNGVSYPMPNGTVIFDPAAPSTSTTTFTGTPGTSSAMWTTTINPSFISDENFLTGAAIPVDFDPNMTGGGQATIQFTTQANDTGLSFAWQWSAAVYTYWPSDWNAALIQPYHGHGLTGSQHADTPDNTQIQKSLIQGPRGGGGSNFTGSWSATGRGACQ